MTLVLELHDDELPNTLCARVKNHEYIYQWEQAVIETASDPGDFGNPKNPWLVRWELVDTDDNTVLAVWTRPSKNNGIPTLTYKHPSYTGEWKPFPHKVYVAGTHHPPDTNVTVVTVAALKANNVTVTSPVGGHDNPPGDVAGTHEARRACAMANYADIDAADVVVVVPCPTHHPLRGVHTEVGYALGKGKPVVVVGTPGCLNTMTEHPNLTYTTLDNLALDIARRSLPR